MPLQIRYRREVGGGAVVLAKDWAARGVALDPATWNKYRTYCRNSQGNFGSANVKQTKADIAEATDVQRRFAFWKRRAQQRPVTVRNRGRDEIVMLAAEEYARLKRRDREVLRAGEFSADDLKAIAAAKVPDEYAPLDDELKVWTS